MSHTDNRRKALVAMVAALGATVAIAACGEDDDSREGEADGSGETHDISFIAGTKNDAYHLALMCGAQSEAKKLDATLSSSAPNEYAAPLQIPLVNAAAAKRPDAMVVAPTDDTALFPPLEQVVAAGSKLVFVDTTLEQEDIAESFVTIDAENGGRTLAKQIAAQMDEGGKVMFITHAPGVTTNELGRRGFETEIKRHPQISYIGNQFDNTDPVKTASVVSGTLARHSDLAGVVTFNGPSAPGVINALRRAGKLGHVKYVAGDATPELVDLLEEGNVETLVFWKPFEIGAEGVRQAVASLDGKPVKQQVLTQPQVATRENMTDPSVSRYFYKGC